MADNFKEAHKTLKEESMTGFKAMKVSRETYEEILRGAKEQNVTHGEDAFPKLEYPAILFRGPIAITTEESPDKGAGMRLTVTIADHDVVQRAFEQCGEEISRLKKNVKGLRHVLSKCGLQFRFYELSHREKSQIAGLTPAMVAAVIKKADANAEFYRLIQLMLKDTEEISAS